MRSKAGDKTEIRPPSVSDVAANKWLTARCLSLPDAARARVKGQYSSASNTAQVRPDPSAVRQTGRLTARVAQIGLQLRR